MNFDTSPTLRLQRIPVLSWIGRKLGPVFPASVRCGDILKGLPVPDQSCGVVYCSHVLEHLSLEELPRALANTYRILRPGGRFRLVMPDLRTLAEQYVAAGENNPEAALTFMRQSWIGQERRPRGVMGMLRGWIGNAQHRWLWDFASTKRELERVGFVNIRRARFGDGNDPKFDKVEDLDRWTNTLGVDCQRPAANATA